ncbi:hypothetical protein [Lysinibacillus xylanilyticus]|nr:hypothetical protein [Lysinibacillus xylanilyticus]
MFFARKRSANAASATRFVCAKAKRQQQHDAGQLGYRMDAMILG